MKPYLQNRRSFLAAGVALSPVRQTDESNGFPEFTFNVPPSSEHNSNDEAGLWVQGRRGDFFQDLTADLPLHQFGAGVVRERVFGSAKNLSAFSNPQG